MAYFTDKSEGVDELKFLDAGIHEVTLVSTKPCVVKFREQEKPGLNFGFSDGTAWAFKRVAESTHTRSNLYKLLRSMTDAVDDCDSWEEVLALIEDLKSKSFVIAISKNDQWSNIDYVTQATKAGQLAQPKNKTSPSESNLSESPPVPDDDDIPF